MGSKAVNRATRKRGQAKPKYKPSHNEGIIPQLALAVREVEASAQRGKATAANRTRFHVVALLMREERSRVKNSAEISDAERAETLKRLEGIAGILAQAASRDTSLIPLLEPDAPITAATLSLKHKMLEQAGLKVPAGEQPTALPQQVLAAPLSQELAEKQVEPAGIKRRLRTQPFLTPQLRIQQQPVPLVRLANWELISPLLKSFEIGGGAKATM